MEMIVVEAVSRSDRGKNAARRTRVAGQIPAVIYGGNGEAEALALNTKQVTAILRSASGHNTIFKVKLPSGEQPAMVRDWQVDPVKGHLLHVDLMRVSMDVRMRVKVPVHTFGEPQGVKMQGGIFEMVTREVEVECLPGDIPEEFKVDVSEMLIGKQLRASDLPFDPNKVKLITDPVRVIAHVVVLKKEEEPAPEAAVAAETAPAEPEVIKKGKKETEEGEAEGGAEAAPKAEKGEKKGKEK